MNLESGTARRHLYRTDKGRGINSARRSRSRPAGRLFGPLQPQRPALRKYCVRVNAYPREMVRNSADTMRTATAANRICRLPAFPRNFRPLESFPLSLSFNPGESDSSLRAADADGKKRRKERGREKKQETKTAEARKRSL